MERFPVNLKPPKEVPFKVPTYRDGEHLKLLITGSHLPIYVTMASTRQGARSGVEADRGTFVPVPTERATAYEDMFLDVAPEAMRAVTEGSTVYANIWSYDPVTGERESWANGEIIKGAAIRDDTFVPPVLSAPKIATEAKAVAEDDEDGTYTVTITPPTANGFPGPSVSLTALRLDGADALELLNGWSLGVEQLDMVRSVSATFAAISSRGSAQSVAAVDVPALPAPIALGALADVSIEEGTGTRTIDAAADFIGFRIRFALQSAPPGVSIDADSGEVSVDGSIVDRTSGRIVVVTATNFSGSASSAFSLIVTAPRAELLNPTAGRNAVDPRLVDFAFDEVDPDYEARLYVGPADEGEFSQAKPQPTQGTTDGRFEGPTHVWLYVVDLDEPDAFVSRVRVASLQPFAPTVAAANLSAQRNAKVPEAIDQINGIDDQVLPPGFTVRFHAGPNPDGDPSATTTVAEGETVQTSRQHANKRFVTGYIFDDDENVVDRELVATLEDISQPKVANAAITATRVPETPELVRMTNGPDDQLMPSDHYVGVYVGPLEEGNPDQVTVVPENGSAVTKGPHPDTEFIVGFIFDGADNVIDKALVATLPPVAPPMSLTMTTTGFSGGNDAPMTSSLITMTSKGFY